MALIDLNRSPRCQHVHYNGKACKAPARKGRNYCVFHQAAHFDAGGCVLPIIEDLHSYQLAVIRIARALAEDAIDPRKATALLYALQLAGWKLKDFTSERSNIEDPEKALSQKMFAHFLCKRAKFPVPTDKELDELLQEVTIEKPHEPNENIAIVPDPLADDDSDAGASEVGVAAGAVQGVSLPGRDVAPAVSAGRCGCDRGVRGAQADVVHHPAAGDPAATKREDSGQGKDIEVREVQGSVG